MTNPFLSKVTAVLSSSCTDSEFRQTLALLDQRNVDHGPETRRQLRLQLQKEVIDYNGNIVDDFGKVADVSRQSSPSTLTS
jgi:hypothetical protein